MRGIKDYTRAIKINPIYDTAYYNRGLMKYGIGDRKGELADYNKTLSINPKYLKAYYNRALLKSEMKDYEGEMQITVWQFSIVNRIPMIQQLGTCLIRLGAFQGIGRRLW